MHNVYLCICVYNVYVDVLLKSCVMHIYIYIYIHYITYVFISLIYTYTYIYVCDPLPACPRASDCDVYGSDCDMCMALIVMCVWHQLW